MISMHQDSPHSRSSVESALADYMLNDHGERWVACVLIGNYRKIVETLGYDAGDQLMEEIEDRLYRWHGETGNVFRYQEDRLLLIFPAGMDPQQQGSSWEADFLAEMRPNVVHVGIPIRIDASYGLVRIDEPDADAREVLRRADVTARRAQESHQAGAIFEHDMIRSGKDGIALLGSLTSAIDTEQLFLVLQPRINTVTRKVIGAEALLRWQHPEKGLVPPAGFIFQAERTDLIQDLFVWTLKAAVGILSDWKKAGLDLILSLNLAARNLDHPGLKDLILMALEEGGVPPSNLELEVTESAIIRDPENACVRLQELRDAGIRIAIDDFGTGHTSLRYLSRLPADVLKIDRSLVSALQESARSREVFSKMGSLAHALKMHVVGEGVEDELTFDYLKHLRCDQAQGFLISPPVDQRRFLQDRF